MERPLRNVCSVFFYELNIPYKMAKKKTGISSFLVGQKATGKVLVIVSFLAGCQSRERLRFIATGSPIAQAHILARPYKTFEFGMSDMTVLSTKTGGSCWQVSVESV